MAALSCVNVATGCIEWTGALTRAGYGQIRVSSGKRVGAHRVAYGLAKGPIPDGLELDHLCRVRHCINANHLEPVTRRENQRRGVSPAAMNARKASCLRGHPLEGENLILSKDGERRTCRKCINVSKAQYYQRNRVDILAKLRAAP